MAEYDIRALAGIGSNYPQRIGQWPAGLYGTFAGLATEIPELAPVLSSIPVLGGFLQGFEQSNQLRAYLSQNGMTMQDVAYPFSAAQQFLPSYASMFGDIRYKSGFKKKKKKKKNKYRYLNRRIRYGRY